MNNLVIPANTFVMLIVVDNRRYNYSTLLNNTGDKRLQILLALIVLAR